MRLRSYIAAGAVALLPALALAGQTDAQSAAQPMFISVNGQSVPVKAETRVVQTASGPMKVSTWSWHSLQGSANFAMRTSTGGVPPEFALRQMQAMQYQMRAAQAQMVAMQQQMQRQMMALQHAAFTGEVVAPAPRTVVFAVPFGVMPNPVIIVNPTQRVTPPTTTAPVKSPGIKV
jgi:hypothetical protein